MLYMLFYLLTLLFASFSFKEDRLTFLGPKQGLYFFCWFLGLAFSIILSSLQFLGDFFALTFLSSSWAWTQTELQYFIQTRSPWHLISSDIQTLRSQSLYSSPLAESCLDLVNSQYIFSQSFISIIVTLVITLSIFYVLLLTRADILITNTLIYLFFVLITSFLFIFSNSLFTMFIAFESLLLSSAGLLKLTSKSERISEAVSEMFMWTLFGSFFLLLGFFITYTDYGEFLTLHYRGPLKTLINLPLLTCSCFVIGFGVKVPTWPFISWLLKAHVEASTEFSILLSGFIVKLGILGMWRMLDFFATPQLYLLISTVSCLAILDATLRLFAQTDLKKIVALTTGIEVNRLNMCYSLGDLNLVFLANYLLIAHSFTTASEFLLVDSISKRYGSRDFWQISGLWFKAPNLWYVSFVVVFITIGFPGSSIFFAKFLFLTTLVSYSIYLFFFYMIIFFLILPLFFVRLWVPIWFGLSVTTQALNPRLRADLSSKELWVFAITIAFSVCLGVCPTLFFSIN